MARPSKLSPEQWREVERRAAEGEVIRALAREFGVDEAAIRRRVSPQTPQIRTVANQLAAAQTALAALPIPQQHIAVSLAEKLRNISGSLACAAELGAATSHRMAALANSAAQAVDDVEPTSEQVGKVAALVKVSNDSALLPLQLIGVAAKASKEGGAFQVADEQLDPATVGDDELLRIAQGR